MKSFKEFCNEMAMNSGINQGGLSRENEFYSLKIYDSNSDDGKLTKLITHDYSSMHFDVYKYGSTYFLSKLNEYYGYIEVQRNDRTCKITSSHSKLKGGFYNLMFSFLLAYADCDEILSDVSLSTQAINSYAALAKKGHLNIQVLTKDGYKDFSKDVLTDTISNRVSVKAKFDLKEFYNQFPRKGTYDEKLFEQMNPAYDEKLFCEPISSYNLSEEYLESINYKE